MNYILIANALEPDSFIKSGCGASKCGNTECFLSFCNIGTCLCCHISSAGAVAIFKYCY